MPPFNHKARLPRASFYTVSALPPKTQLHLPQGATPERNGILFLSSKEMAQDITAFSLYFTSSNVCTGLVGSNIYL